MDQLALSPADAERALHLPIGMVSPLWAPFTFAATAGAAWYWMTQWRRTNLEAFMAPVKAAEPAETIPVPVAQVVMAVMPEPVAPDSDGAIEAEFEAVEEEKPQI